MKSYIIITLALTSALSLTNVHAQDWEISHEQNNLEYLFSLSFPDSIHGWAVGDKPGDSRALIVHTDDGGVSWQEQTGALSTRLVDVHFMDSLVGFSLSVFALQKTINGGDEWTEMDLPINSARLIDLEFEGSTGWILDELGLLFKSIDGGDSWEQLDSIPLNEMLLSDMVFSGPDTGVVVGFHSVPDGRTDIKELIFQTTDGGNSWIEREVEFKQPDLTGSVLFTVEFADRNTVFAAGRGGYVLKSEDAGHTWKEVTIIKDDVLTHLTISSLYFEDANRGWVLGLKPPYFRSVSVFRTRDGGHNWFLEDWPNMENPVAEAWDIMFDESGMGWMCGQKSGDMGSESMNGAMILRRVPGIEIYCKDTIVYLDETCTALVTPEDVDNGSFAAGGIDSMWVVPDVFTRPSSKADVTLNVRDGSGKVETCNSKVNVIDTIAPIAVCKDITIQLDSTGYASISGSDVDGGSWGNCFKYLYVSPSEFTIEDVGVQEVRLLVDAGINNRDSCIAYVTVEAPVSIGPGRSQVGGIASISSYPNPFESVSSIAVEMIETEEISLKVYNATGKLVKLIFKGELITGRHSFSFEPDQSGSSLYICVLETKVGTTSQLLFKR